MRQEETKEIHDQMLKRRFHTSELLRILGIDGIPPLTAVSDAGSDPLTVESHLSQCGHLVAMMKIASAGWLIAEENSIRQKVAAAQRYNVPVAMGSEVFIVSQTRGQIEAYLDLCADIGVSKLEVDYFTVRSSKRPREFALAAMKRNLQFIIEITLHDHGFSQRKVVDQLLDRAKDWIDAGAVNVVLTDVERQSPLNSLSPRQVLNYRYIDPFAKTFGLHTVIFDTRDAALRMKLCDYFGPDVNLGGVRFDELLEVESYRRGLHPQALRSRNKRRGTAAAGTTYGTVMTVSPEQE